MQFKETGYGIWMTADEEAEMEKLALCKSYLYHLPACVMYSSAITGSPVNNEIFRINTNQNKPVFLH